jgi:CDP-glucose 4,6-dehydratase
VADVSAERFWPGKRVLVTGATGLVGGWVVRALLAEGAHVVALVRDPDRRSDFYRSGADRRAAIVAGQVEEYATLTRAIVEHEVDTVVHLAAQPIVGAAQRAPLATLETNVRGTYNLLEACRVHADLVRRVAIASSDKAYGDHGGAAYEESSPLSATHPYDASKACADILARAYAHTYALPVAIARAGNVYGGGDLNWSRIVPGTLRSLLHGERPVLRSDGTSRRDYVYGPDVARGYLALAQHAERDDVRGQAFNLSCEAPESVLGVVARLATLVDRRDLAPIILNTASGEIPHQAVSAARARRVLGWSPRHDLDAGLRETVAWYRHFFADTQPAPLEPATR